MHHQNHSALSLVLSLAAVTVALGCGTRVDTQTKAAETVPADDDGGASVPVLFVGNMGEGTLSLIHEDTFTALGTLNVIPDGDTPRDATQAVLYPSIVAAKGKNFVQGIAVSEDGRSVYVSRGYLGDVAAIDLASGAVKWRVQMPGLRADHVVLAPDHKRLFVSAITANVVKIIDVTRGEIVGEVKGGTYPHVLEVTPGGRELAIGSMGDPSAAPGHEGETSLTFVDLQTLHPNRTLMFDAGVRPFVFAPDGDKVYVQLSLLNGLVEADVASGTILRRLGLPVSGPAVGLAPGDYPNHAAHHGIALSGDGSSLCVAATVSNYIALVDRASLAVTATLPADDQPADALTSRDGRHCFVTSRGPSARSVSVISFDERREVAHVHVGDRPQEMIAAVVPRDVLRGTALGSKATP
jgi:DNA-binding beta-propeller fold protein YncE